MITIDPLVMVYINMVGIIVLSVFLYLVVDYTKYCVDSILDRTLINTTALVFYLGILYMLFKHHLPYAF